MIKVITTEKIPIKMWLETIEDSALQQAKNLANLPFAYKWISLMGDSHSGYGMPIGGVLATQGVIIPNAVGVDIGCGMIAVETCLRSDAITKSMLQAIVEKIQQEIPVGFAHQSQDQEWIKFDEMPDIPILNEQLSSARKQLGTLGQGNHFCEVQKEQDGHVWLMIHSGSRNLGLKVANTYHKKAQALCERWYSNIPDKDLAFLPMETSEGKEYYEAMKFCIEFAYTNRARMMAKVEEIFSDITKAPQTGKFINIHHNYAAFEHHYGKNVLVHRKGATKADVGQLGIIPGSMGTSSYIVEGLGNPESFHSCSHGAGRVMGRNEAKKTLNLTDEQAKMQHVVHGLNSNNLDEAPGAYKNIDEVMHNQNDLVKIVAKLVPLASVKG